MHTFTDEGVCIVAERLNYCENPWTSEYQMIISDMRSKIKQWHGNATNIYS